jgi:hypothetical protein
MPGPALPRRLKPPPSKEGRVRRRYEIRIDCAMSDTLRAAFAEFDAVQVGPRTTVLSGELRDQSALHGVLARLGDLGIEITEVRPEP